jgi:pantoate--beta-alanine ligase
MIVITDRNKLQETCAQFRSKNKTIGFIPTMGALHAGHLSLVRKSTRNNDVTVVSIFVNPAQFSPTEDLNKYPRPIKKDKKILEGENVDILFYPAVLTMYPNGFQTSVVTTKLANIIEGKSRPGHFNGMATIVLKLFNLVNPTRAYFGQKDFQQSLVVRQMVYDLNLPIKINVVPTVREKDGLALSSRNVFLSSRERLQASSLYRSLMLGKKLIISGSKNALSIKTQIKKYLKKYDLVHVDYIEICDPENLSILKVISKKTVILITAYVGKTRLIDNVIIKL